MVVIERLAQSELTTANPKESGQLIVSGGVVHGKEKAGPSINIRDDSPIIKETCDEIIEVLESGVAQKVVNVCEDGTMGSSIGLGLGNTMMDLDVGLHPAGLNVKPSDIAENKPQSSNGAKAGPK
ncbi:hypothetical protein Q3G72_000867 [Acer saccharum]|nr:hypothetical protein Q3G72_000867 [Acer saccharum]